MVILLIVATLCISAGLTYYLSQPHAFLHVASVPNARSLHTRPVPVSGGVAILIAFAVAMLGNSGFYALSQPILWLGLTGFLIAIISFIDDTWDVPALYRLLVHFVAAYLLLWQGDLWLESLILPGLTIILPLPLTIIISLLFIVWMTNLYNFMDGMDGFAGGMALFGFGGFAVLGYWHDHLPFTLINLSLVSAVAGFLRFNFPPAKIFMGDTGASSLGFLAGALSLWGQQEGLFPLWIAFLLFSPFIVDATVTLGRRLLQREKVWLGHKSHYYQRLVQLGWGHLHTVLWEYGLMALCGISALGAFWLPIYAQWGLLSVWIIIYVGLIYWVNHLEQQTSLYKQVQ